MMINFEIRIVDGDGNGVPDTEVVVHYPHGIDQGRTDQDGWVRFEREHYFGDSVQTTVYVEGQSVDQSVWFADGDTISFKI